MMKANPKSKLKTKTTVRRVIPFSAKGFKETVVTIGYKTENVLSVEKLKENFQELKDRLGGKGAGLAAIAKLKISVPPAFNLSTSLCGLYLSKSRLPDQVVSQMRLALAGLEKKLDRKFGNSKRPLLVSVRSGARVSMPGMMDTILNLGLTNEITKSLATAHPDRARFWWDCYRRLIQMFSEVVLGVHYDDFEDILTRVKSKEGASTDADISVKGLQQICTEYRDLVSKKGKTFPEDPWTQLLLATEAVFRSWNTERAVTYRRIHNYSDDWGTAVTIQAMVFGNLNENSGTGVVFTRNPSTGAKELYGEYLLNAQGEDVVAGIRTPHPIEKMKQELPKTFVQLVRILKTLEDHFRDAQDVEFTVEDENLFILQTRTAKRTASASVENFIQLVREKKISTDEALEKLTYDHVRQLLHPSLKAAPNQKSVARGLAASPGAAAGRVAFSPEAAVTMNRAGYPVILVRRETSPEDIMGMSVSKGILTSTGGMTSHAAVVGRGMGKCCVVGCADLNVDEKNKKASVGDHTIQEEDWVTLNGSTGEVFLGELPTEPVTWGESAKTYFQWADKLAQIPVYANADTPEQAEQARNLGARGIGLCRTEHMFFDKERIRKFRLMILSENETDRAHAADELRRYQVEDFFGILKAMEGYPVTVRLLDPPLHEFLPAIEHATEIEELAAELKTSTAKLTQRIFQLRETNPMLGHRGCRLGVTFPEIYEMQARALCESLYKNLQQGINAQLKIMIPLTLSVEELNFLLKRLKAVYEKYAEELCEENPKLLKKLLAHTKWGTMIELPRACLVAGELAPLIDFVSFGTNDLTQTALGISRDDAAKFIPTYLEKGIFKVDPFESIDEGGVGRLVAMAVTEGRRANPKLDVGVCGEHGGDPQSINFFCRLDFNSVSCSPFRVPIARLALARSFLDLKASKRKKGKA